MKKLILLLITVAASYPVVGEDKPYKSGENLHNAHCIACHNNSVYTRKNRNVRTLIQLVQQIKGCNHQLSKNFSDKEKKDLLNYLNHNFYKFKK